MNFGSKTMPGSMAAVQVGWMPRRILSAQSSCCDETSLEGMLAEAAEGLFNLGNAVAGERTLARSHMEPLGKGLILLFGYVHSMLWITRRDLLLGMTPQRAWSRVPKSLRSSISPECLMDSCRGMLET